MIRKGTYVLFLHIPCDTTLRIGALGESVFRHGYYCYVGSAMVGLDQRLNRHLSKDKRLRWHIDHLTMIADEMYAYESFGEYIEECDLARLMIDSGAIPVVEGFGCSDCDCHTHLFSVVPSNIERILVENGLTRFVPKIE